MKNKVGASGKTYDADDIKEIIKHFDYYEIILENDIILYEDYLL